MDDLPRHGKQNNAFATSCYRVMLNIKRIVHVLNTTVYSMTNTVPLIHLVRHRQLKFLGHILRMSKEEPARRYALYIPTIGKRRPPSRPRTSYLTYVQRLLGDNEGAMQEQLITALGDDRRAWRNLRSRWMIRSSPSLCDRSAQDAKN